MVKKPKLVSGSVKVGEKIEGQLEFKDVTFEYPTRPGQKNYRQYDSGI